MVYIMQHQSNQELINLYFSIRKKEISYLSLKIEHTHLLLLLNYANGIPFEDLPLKSSESFINYLLDPKNRRDGKESQLSYEYIRKAASSAKNFFLWLRDDLEMKSISNRWIKTFSYSQPASEKNVVEYFTIDEIIQIVSTPAANLKELRTRASCGFLFLSGMRIKAFVTLPILAVDINCGTVKQWPSLGVRTKLQYKATTRLLNIDNYPEIFNVVKTWDETVKSILPEYGMWFGPISPQTGKIHQPEYLGEYRDSGFRKDLKEFLKKVGIPYRSPHGFRHAHIRFLKDRAKTMRDLDAIAINAMQTTATMLSYGQLNKIEALSEIDRLCQVSQPHITSIKNHDIPDNETIHWVLNFIQQEHGGMNK
jgi:integrase